MTDQAKDGGPAFPLSRDYHAPQLGMSLRDWFAGQFLGGAVISDEPLHVPVDSAQEVIDAALLKHWSNVAHVAYIAADAMLAERVKHADATP